MIECKKFVTRFFIFSIQAYLRLVILQILIFVRDTLTDLLLAIEGTIIMNEQLRNALDNIFDARVPDVWKRSSWESSTLGFWFTELLDRNKQFSTWLYQVCSYSNFLCRL